MSNALFRRGDGSGRPLRESQEYVLTRLRQIWFQDDKPIVILGQTGLGKSMIARTIQNQFNGAIVTPQNELIRQYISDYPDMNYWWGESNFNCHSPGYHVEGCPYHENRKKAVKGEKTIFNPMSMYWLRRHNVSMAYAPVTIIDEAHAVLSMLYALNIKEFNVEEEPQAWKLQTTYNLREWLQKKSDYAKEMWDAYEGSGEMFKAKKWRSVYYKHASILHGLLVEPECYAINYNGYTKKLHVQCTHLPRKVIDDTFGPGRKVLLSGTIFRPDIIELLGTSDYHLIEPPSAIPIEKRKIYFQPTPFKVNYNTNREQLAYFINRIIARYSQGERTLIHLPYSWAEEVAKHLNRPTAITHDETDKEDALKKFKNTPGSILIACGMAEGINLKGDLCRLNIIPKILWPNRGDDFVIKKSGQGVEGQVWYKLEAAKTLIQQAGRSTRGPDDWSITIVMDPSFTVMLDTCSEFLPKSFLDAVVLSSDNITKG